MGVVWKGQAVVAAALLGFAVMFATEGKWGLAALEFGLSALNAVTAWRNRGRHRTRTAQGRSGAAAGVGANSGTLALAGTGTSKVKCTCSPGIYVCSACSIYGGMSYLSSSYSTGAVTAHINALLGVTPERQREDFAGADFDLSVGEVFGLRVWKVDPYGRLRALHVTAPPWRPGVNTAVCNRSSMLELWDGRPGEKCSECPGENCRCGFYAYTQVGHEELNQANADGHLLGMVRGTGRTLIGTKGFRCEKAEIVALLEPTHLAPGRAAAVRQVYADVPLMSNLAALLEFAPLSSTLPKPDSEDFWTMP